MSGALENKKNHESMKMRSMHSRGHGISRMLRRDSVESLRETQCERTARPEEMGQVVCKESKKENIPTNDTTVLRICIPREGKIIVADIM